MDDNPFLAKKANPFMQAAPAAAPAYPGGISNPTQPIDQQPAPISAPSADNSNPILREIDRAAGGDQRIATTMRNIYGGESGHKNQWDVGDSGASGGPFQLDTADGRLGADFMKAYPGEDPRHPSSLAHAADFTADWLRKHPNADTSKIWFGLGHPERFSNQTGGYGPNDFAAQSTPAPATKVSTQSSDYDYEGFKASGQKQGANGHYPDTFKLPNHMTFSSESKYSKPGQEGGKWSQVDGKWHYAPSEWNLKQHTAAEMQDYFKKTEPDSVLDLPSDNPFLAKKANPFLQAQPAGKPEEGWLNKRVTEAAEPIAEQVKKGWSQITSTDPKERGILNTGRGLANIAGGADPQRPK